MKKSRHKEILEELLPLPKDLLGSDPQRLVTFEKFDRSIVRRYYLTNKTMPNTNKKTKTNTLVLDIDCLNAQKLRPWRRNFSDIDIKDVNECQCQIVARVVLNTHSHCAGHCAGL